MELYKPFHQPHAYHTPPQADLSVTQASEATLLSDTNFRKDKAQIGAFSKSSQHDTVKHEEDNYRLFIITVGSFYTISVY